MKDAETPRAHTVPSPKDELVHKQIRNNKVQNNNKAQKHTWTKHPNVSQHQEPKCVRLKTHLKLSSSETSIFLKISISFFLSVSSWLPQRHVAQSSSLRYNREWLDPKRRPASYIRALGVTLTPSGTEVHYTTEHGNETHAVGR